MKCVPATNRMSGPRLGAANAPVKKRPGTLDSRLRFSTGAPAKDFEVGAKRGCDVVEASHVEVEAGPGDDVIRAFANVALGVAQVESNALAHLLGADELVPEKHRHRPFDAPA